MILTQQQIAVLRADVVANSDTAALYNSGDRAGLAAAYNANASPDYWIWKSSVSLDEIMQNGFDWTQVDNTTVGKARIWEWMFNNDLRSIDPRKANIRSGIDEAWKGTSAMLAVRASVYAHCKRLASRFEKLFSTGSGTEGSPSVTEIEGPVTDTLFIEV